MAATGQFVQDLIPIPLRVPEAARLMLELVQATPDSHVEPAGPMTWRIVRRYRPTWATVLIFLIFPLFIKRTDVCRVAIAEGRSGAELLLDGDLDPSLYEALHGLSRTMDPGRQAAPTLLPPSEPIAETYAANGHGSLHDAHVLDPYGANGHARAGTFDLPPSPGPLAPAPLAPAAAPAPRPAPAGATQFDASHIDAGQHDQAQFGAAQYEAAQYEAAPYEVAQYEAVEVAPTTAMAPSRPSVDITVDTGENTVLADLLLVGRAPVRGELDATAQLLPINDPSLSVSKTHLAIGMDATGVWVEDRNSTNGSWLDAGDGQLRKLDAGVRVPVPPGTRVMIGERVVTLSRS